MIQAKSGPTYNIEHKFQNIQGTHHSILWGSLSQAPSETVNRRDIVLVSSHQPSPCCGIYLFWGFPVNDVWHTAGFPQLIVARNTVITSSLNIPRNKVPGTFLLVGVFEESVPIGVAYLQIAGWSGLVRKTHHLVLPLVSEHKASFWIVSVTAGERDEITDFINRLLTQRNGLVAANPFCP